MYTFFQVGQGKIGISMKTYNGYDSVDIRRFSFFERLGEFVPLKKGISIPRKLFFEQILPFLNTLPSTQNSQNEKP